MELDTATLKKLAPVAAGAYLGNRAAALLGKSGLVGAVIAIVGCAVGVYVGCLVGGVKLA